MARNRRVGLAFVPMSILSLPPLLFVSCGGGGDTPSPTASVFRRFAYLPNGGDNTLSIFTVGAVTGQLRHDGYVGAGAGPASVAVDPPGRFACVANGLDDTVSACRFDATTAAIAPVAGSPFPAKVGPDATAISRTLD